jgi:hypothetical protein
MRAGKSIADKNIPELGKLRREGRIILFFAAMESEIFEHGDIAILKRPDGRRSCLPDAIGAKRYVTAK